MHLKGGRVRKFPPFDFTFHFFSLLFTSFLYFSLLFCTFHFFSLLLTPFVLFVVISFDTIFFVFFFSLRKHLFILLHVLKMVMGLPICCLKVELMLMPHKR